MAPADPAAPQEAGVKVAGAQAPRHRQARADKVSKQVKVVKAVKRAKRALKAAKARGDRAKAR